GVNGGDPRPEERERLPGVSVVDLPEPGEEREERGQRRVLGRTPVLARRRRQRRRRARHSGIGEVAAAHLLITPCSTRATWSRAPRFEFLIPRLPAPARPAARGPGASSPRAPPGGGVRAGGDSPRPGRSCGRCVPRTPCRARPSRGGSPPPAAPSSR